MVNSKSFDLYENPDIEKGGLLLERKKMKQFYSQFKFLKNGSKELLQQWGSLFGVTDNAWQNKADIDLEDIFDR